MNRYIVLVMIVLAGLLAGANSFAQGRNHDVIMRDIRTAYRSLGENLEANEQSGAVEDASQLEGFYREIEAFWTRLETQDAEKHISVYLPIRIRMQAQLPSNLVTERKSTKHFPNFP